MNADEVAELVRGLPAGPAVADGKSKTLHATARPDVCLMELEPHARSIASRREEDVPGSDDWRILATLEILNFLSAAVPTHLLYPKAISTGGRLYLAVSRARPIPIEWICRYEAAGSIVRLFPGLVRPGQRFDEPLFKYDCKQDVGVAGVDDPMLNESYIVGLGLLTEPQLQTARGMLAIVGSQVRARLCEAGMRLIDMKMEFGFMGGQMALIDEISQDCIRAVDDATNRPLTKDVFRLLKSPAEVVLAYEQFARRLNANIEELIWRMS